MPTSKKVKNKKQDTSHFIAILSAFIAIFALHILLIVSTPECEQGLAGLFCSEKLVLNYVTPALTVVAVVLASMLVVSIIPVLKSAKRFRAIILTILIVVATVTPAAIQTNILPYSLSTIKCGGLPVESFTVIGSSQYRLPGEDGYGINPASEYTMCTQNEAEATLAYHGREQTKALAEKGRNYLEESKEAARFSPEKVTYELYVPNPNIYTIEDLRISEIHQVNHSFFTVKKNGNIIGRVREVPSSNDYNLCAYNNPAERYCTQIGLSSNGSEIYREQNKGLRGWNSQYAGANIGNTGIIVQSDIDQDVIDLINAMTPYKD